MLKIHPEILVMAALAAILLPEVVLPATDSSHLIPIWAKNTYVFQTYLAKDSITIEMMDNNIAILTGRVSDSPHQILAQETVEGLPGVIRVDNNLEVNGGNPDAISDSGIGRNVRTMLMFHKYSNDIKAVVSVRKGAVRIRGVASKEAYKGLSTQYILNIKGVNAVDIYMVFVTNSALPTCSVKEIIDDASITAIARVALQLNRSNNTTVTKIETNNGIVTISGVALCEGAKTMIDTLIGTMKGVKSIENNMVIEDRVSLIKRGLHNMPGDELTSVKESFGSTP